MTRPQRTTLANFKHYDIILTTAFEAKHGVSGHTFELIEYYYAIKHFTNLSPCILLADGTTLEQFHACVADRYDMDPIENVFVVYQPKVLICNNILLVDGSFRLRNCQLLTKNIFIFRCHEEDFSYFEKHKANFFLLNDHDVYEDKIGIHYKKKILFSKFKQIPMTVEDTAMMYLTTNCRARPIDEVNRLFAKHGHKHNIILTNDPNRYEGAKATVYTVPVDDLWNRFTTYIYTTVPGQLDCSPRFVIECRHYGKEVVFEIDYKDRGLETRLNDPMDAITLDQSDYFLELLREQIKPSEN